MAALKVMLSPRWVCPGLLSVCVSALLLASTCRSAPVELNPTIVILGSADWNFYPRYSDSDPYLSR